MHEARCLLHQFICFIAFTEVGGLMLNFHETPARYEEAVESCSDIGSRLVEIRDVGTGEQVHKTNQFLSKHTLLHYWIANIVDFFSADC